MLYYIYQIFNPILNLNYIGSTKMKLKYRLEQHKHPKNRCSSFILFLDKNHDVKIELLEKMETDDKQDVLYQERQYIEQTDNCVNKNIPIRSNEELTNYKNKWYKQYRLKNIDRVNLAQSKYKAKNLDKIKEYQHNYYLKKKQYQL